MGDRTGIEWTDATWNPISGCSKVSQGCKFCYAERVFPRPYPGRKFTDVQVHDNRIDQPQRWKKPRRIFVNSMSDLFHESLSFRQIDRIFASMALAPQHTYQVLTKRAQRMSAYMAEIYAGRMYQVAEESGHDEPNQTRIMQSFALGLPQLHLGVSVENQATADERIPHLLATQAAIRFLSCEPLLGSIELTTLIGKGSFPGESSPVVTWTNALTGERGHFVNYAKVARGERLAHVDWVIVGGESGPHARPMHPDWARALRVECNLAEIAFFFKQWGEWLPRGPESLGYPSIDGVRTIRLTDTGEDGSDLNAGGFAHVWMQRAGKKVAGRDLDGRTWDEFPKVAK